MPKISPLADYAAARREQTVQAVTSLRTARGWTQDQLAQALGRSRAHINRIENGEASYTLEELEFLTAVFGLPVGHLTWMSPATEDRLNLALTAYQTHEALLAHHTVTLDQAASQAVPVLRFHPRQPLLTIAYRAQSERGVLLTVTPGGHAAWRYEHRTAIHTFTYSPDGAFIALGTANDTVVVLDSNTRDVVATLDPVEQALVDQHWWNFTRDHAAGSGVISDIVFSPNGHLLAYLNKNTGTLRLWKTADWSHHNTIPVNHLQIRVHGREYYVEDDPAHADPDDLYGEVHTSGLQFAPDNRTIYLFPAYSDYLEQLDIDGRKIRRQELDFRPTARAEILTHRQHGAYPYILLTGTQQTLRIKEHSGRLTNVHLATPHTTGCISNLLVLDHHTVLASTRPGDAPSDYVTIKNLVNNRPITLHAPNATDSLVFAPDGTYFAYFDQVTWMKSPYVVHIYQLDLAKLRDERTIADLLYDPQGVHHREFQRALPLPDESAAPPEPPKTAIAPA